MLAVKIALLVLILALVDAKGCNRRIDVKKGTKVEKTLCFLKKERSGNLARRLCKRHRMQLYVPKSSQASLTALRNFAKKTFKGNDKIQLFVAGRKNRNLCRVLLGNGKLGYIRCRLHSFVVCEYKKAARTTPAITTTTLAPTVPAPTTIAPTTIAPTTIAPTTIAPTTTAPTTIAPTTTAPTTIAPTTTGTTTTARPTTTAAPTTAYTRDVIPTLDSTATTVSCTRYWTATFTDPLVDFTGITTRTVCEFYGVAITSTQTTLQAAPTQDVNNIFKIDMFMQMEVLFLPIQMATKFPELRALDAGGCSIRYLFAANFEGLAKLTFLELTDNFITELDATVFTGVPKLRYLGLVTPLKALTTNIFSTTWPELRTVYLYGCINISIDDDHAEVALLPGSVSNTCWPL